MAKIFSSLKYIFEVIFFVLLMIISIMFFVASIDNMKIQSDVKKFINSAVFEKEENDICYYYVPTNDLETDTIIKDADNGYELVLGDVGDIFVMPQSRMDMILFSEQFITYLFGGHAGIVRNQSLLIEAMGAGGQDYVETNFTDLLSEERTVIGLRPSATYEERVKAVKNAESLIGKRYNYLFIFDTKDKYYCTDLCSRVYGREFGMKYKFDKNGFHVSCQELVKAEETRISFVKIVKDDKLHIYYLKNESTK